MSTLNYHPKCCPGVLLDVIARRPAKQWLVNGLDAARAQ